MTSGHPINYTTLTDVTIMREHALSAGQIRKVRVDTFEQAAALDNSSNPQTYEAAQYSVPYSLGIAATLGERMLSPIPISVLNHGAAIDFARRVEVRHVAEMDAFLPLRTASRVTVQTDNRSIEQMLIVAWGDADGTTTRADLREKFLNLTEKRISKARSRQIISAVDGLKTSGLDALSAVLPSPLVTGGCNPLDISR